MLEKVAELDDALAEKYLTDPNSLTEAEIIAALRKGTIEFKAHPLFCGSAYKYVGVQAVLNGVIDFLPSPLDLPATKGHDVKEHEKIIERKRVPEDPFCGLAFKIVDDKFGTLTYVRVYSGVLEQGTRVLNANKNSKGEHQPDVPDVGQRPHPARACRGGRHRRGHRRERGDDRRHALRPGRADHPRAADVPEPVISMSIEPEERRPTRTS
jgi:elongation factor G